MRKTPDFSGVFLYVCTNFNNLCLAQNWCITSISQIEVGVYRVLNREGNDIELDLDNNLLDS